MDVLKINDDDDDSISPCHKILDFMKNYSNEHEIYVRHQTFMLFIKCTDKFIQFAQLEFS